MNSRTYTHERAQGRCGSQTGDAGVIGRVHEEDSKKDDVGSHQTAVNDVKTWQHQWGTVDNALKLSVIHDGATEGHTSNVDSKEESNLLVSGGRVSFEVREVIDVGGDACDESSDTNH